MRQFSRDSALDSDYTVRRREGLFELLTNFANHAVDPGWKEKNDVLGQLDRTLLLLSLSYALKYSKSHNK